MWCDLRMVFLAVAECGIVNGVMSVVAVLASAVVRGRGNKVLSSR